MSSNPSTSAPVQYHDTFSGHILSVAVVGRDDRVGNEVAEALAGTRVCTTKMFFYPERDAVPQLMNDPYEVFLIDLDGDPEYALELTESICIHGTATVMVYSSQANPELMLRCMRAGAREYLTRPFTSDMMGEALVRAWSRRSVAPPAAPKKATGQLFSFLGAKGGCGTTTLALNFAVALAHDTGKETLLVDLSLPLGDAALNLGISAQYSIIDALQNSGRLDANFLSSLLTKHSSGLHVLAAPSHFIQAESTHEAVDKLIAVARTHFEYIVLDLGTRLDLTRTALFAPTSTIYLVTQAGIPDLRNANRLITEFFTSGGPRLEIVVNRSTSRSMGIEEEHITKALTRSAQWKVPGDWVTAKRTQNFATPLVLEDSPISRVIQQMARSVSKAVEATEKKKKRFGLFAKPSNT